MGSEMCIRDRILDGDGCNPANTSDGQVSTRLQAFAEMLEKNKEEKHS